MSQASDVLLSLPAEEEDSQWLDSFVNELDEEAVHDQTQQQHQLIDEENDEALALFAQHGEEEIESDPHTQSLTFHTDELEDDEFARHFAEQDDEGHQENHVHQSSTTSAVSQADVDHPLTSHDAIASLNALKSLSQQSNLSSLSSSSAATASNLSLSSASANTSAARKRVGVAFGANATAAVSSTSSQPLLAPGEKSEAMLRNEFPTTAALHGPKEGIMDPVTGFRISHRIISSISVQEKLSSCTRVSLKEVSQHFNALELFIARAKSQTPNTTPQLDTQQVTAIQNGTFVPLMGKNWVTFGVLVTKQLPKDTSNGNSKYVTWYLSDLLGVTIRVMLFARAFEENWKTNEGTVIALANPQHNAAFMMQNTNKPTAGALCLNLRSSGQLLAIGDAADFGYCAAYKNEPGSTHHKGMVKCKQVVNLSKSPYCDYHVKSAYNSVKSKRMNLNQARGPGAIAFPNHVPIPSAPTFQSKTGLGVSAAQRAAAAGLKRPSSAISAHATAQTIERRMVQQAQAARNGGVRAAPMINLQPAAVVKAAMEKERQGLSSQVHADSKILRRLQGVTSMNNSASAAQTAAVASKPAVIAPANGVIIKSSAINNTMKTSLPQTGADKPFVAHAVPTNLLVARKPDPATTTPNSASSTATPTLTQRANSLSSQMSSMKPSSSTLSSTAPTGTAKPNTAILSRPSTPSLASTLSSAGSALTRPTPASSTIPPSLSMNSSTPLASQSSAYTSSLTRPSPASAPTTTPSTLTTNAKTTTPQLGRGWPGMTSAAVNNQGAAKPFNMSAEDRERLARRAAAIEAIKAAGGISKPDPNSTKTPAALIKRVVQEEVKESMERGGKKAADSSADDARDVKRQKLLNAFHLDGPDSSNQDAKNKLDAILDAKSSHQDLAKEASSKLSRRDLAFIESLEAREKMAVQMEGVHELEVQVFKCQDASCGRLGEYGLPQCKAKGHLIRKVSAMKRFFTCAECKHHVGVVAVRMPNISCVKCGATRWNKAGMGQVKLAADVGSDLQITSDNSNFSLRSTFMSHQSHTGASSGSHADDAIART